MDHAPHSMEMQMRMVSHMSNNPEHQHFSVSNEHMGLVDQMSSNPGFNALMVPIDTVGRGGSSGATEGLRPNGKPSQLAREDAVTLNSMTGHNASLPMKRKAEMGPMVNTSNSLPNKLPAHMGDNANLHGFLSPSASQRRPGLGQPNSGMPSLQAQSALNKKTISSESMANKPALQRGRPPKKQTTQIESATKSRPESSEAIRSKMRENLASALALASQKQDNVANSKKDQSDAAISQQRPVNTQASDSCSALDENRSGSGSQEVPKDLAVVSTTNDPLVLSSDLPPNGSSMDGGHTFPEFQYTSIFPDVDVPFSDNFFVKDDLLAGNGLSWAFDFDIQKREGEEAQNADKAKLVEEGNVNEHGDKDTLPSFTPEELAFQIEAELFKLFGGVNKKYKEKGRSLLFNLKDRNNPELKERVMSGEIPPERLCSMSAEELASKELSEWRMTKAEEMAQMVVLPDTDGDMRRLVKKTHKGEYQVEFERDDGIVEEVSGGTSMLSRPQPKKKTESKSFKDEENASVQKNVSENQDLSGSLIIPTDGTDLMQGMMVDELKDTASLPPIVSLDEFMESLNSEPPFENLSPNGLQKTSETHREEKPNVMSKFKAFDQASDSPKDASSRKFDFIKKQEPDTTIKSIKSPKQNVIPSIASEAENIWEGSLQLNISSSVTVFGQFQSGEKTSAKEWPTSLEIKGRVRLEAFEKFLQELPMSRTRAVMVLHINLKDKSYEREGRDFSEAVESYSTDERLGYAEPAPGVELYLCPPTPRMAEMLNKHLPKHHRPETTKNISAENGLIGVVVWRRAHMSSNNISSPNSSSAHNKHTMKKQLSFSSTATSTGPNRMQNSSNVNVSSSTLSRPPLVGSVYNKPVKPEPHEEDEEDEDDEDDDIPPGFGPGAAKKDDDDLPEFNFSSHLNPHTPTGPRIAPQNLSTHGLNVMPPQRPVDQVRELIKKYGQIGTSTGGGAVTSSDRRLGIEPWNDDDDDDIPEWRPEAPPQMVHGHRLPGQLHPMGSPQRPRGGATGRWPLQGPRWRPY